MIERLEATVDDVLTCHTLALKIGRSRAPNHQYYRVGAPGLSGAPGPRSVRRSALSVELRQVRTSFGKIYPIIRCGIERVSSVGLLFRRPFRKIRLLTMAAIRPAFGNK